MTLQDSVKLYNGYTNEPFPFLVNDRTIFSKQSIFASNNPLIYLEITYYKLTVSEKIRIINNRFLVYLQEILVNMDF